MTRALLAAGLALGLAGPATAQPATGAATLTLVGSDGETLTGTYPASRCGEPYGFAGTDRAAGHWYEATAGRHTLAMGDVAERRPGPQRMTADGSWLFAITGPDLASSYELDADLPHEITVAPDFRTVRLAGRVRSRVAPDEAARAARYPVEVTFRCGVAAPGAPAPAPPALPDEPDTEPTPGPVADGVDTCRLVPARTVDEIFRRRAFRRTRVEHVFAPGGGLCRYLLSDTSAVHVTATRLDSPEAAGRAIAHSRETMTASGVRLTVFDGAFLLGADQWHEYSPPHGRERVVLARYGRLVVETRALQTGSDEEIARHVAMYAGYDLHDAFARDGP